MTNAQRIKKELQNCNKLPLFEIPVLRDGKTDWILYNISVDTEKSTISANDITFDIDENRSLDYYIEGLFEAASVELLNQNYIISE